MVGGGPLLAFAFACSVRKCNVARWAPVTWADRDVLSVHEWWILPRINQFCFCPMFHVVHTATVASVAMARDLLRYTGVGEEMCVVRGEGGGGGVGGGVSMPISVANCRIPALFRVYLTMCRYCRAGESVFRDAVPSLPDVVDTINLTSHDLP